MTAFLFLLLFNEGSVLPSGVLTGWCLVHLALGEAF